MAFIEDSKKLLALGSLVFGAWGLIHPRSLTGLSGDGPRLGRPLGIRDTVIGVGLLSAAAPVALGARMASDVHDAVRLRERSPVVALIAALTVVWEAAVVVESARAFALRRARVVL